MCRGALCRMQETDGDAEVPDDAGEGERFAPLQGRDDCDEGGMKDRPPGHNREGGASLDELSELSEPSECSEGTRASSLLGAAGEAGRPPFWTATGEREAGTCASCLPWSERPVATVVLTNDGLFVIFSCLLVYLLLKLVFYIVFLPRS